MTPDEELDRSQVKHRADLCGEDRARSGRRCTAVARVKDYYVVFWKQPLIRDADRRSGATQEDLDVGGS